MKNLLQVFIHKGVIVNNVSPRCFDSPAISPVDVKIFYRNSSFPSFGRIVVESTIDASTFRNNGTISCEASNDVARSTAFFNFAVKGSGQNGI